MRRGEQTSSGAAASVVDGRNAWLGIGGWAAIVAGVAGLLGLLSVIPWPQLFSIDANPGNAVLFDPGLKVVLVGHYVILVAGAASGLLAAGMLAVALRRRVGGLLGALLLLAACAALAWASTVRAVDLTVNDGRASQDVAVAVAAGGGVLLVAVVVLTLALRRQTGTGFLVLGLGTPVLVAGGIAMFALLGPDVYPNVWGVTFPPPSDYLLAVWFIGLGQVMRGPLAPVSRD